MTILKGFDINNDLSKIYEEMIPAIKQKNIIKEQEVFCEDISVFLNAWRDNKKSSYQNNTDYGSNQSGISLDDKGKKKLDLLQGIRKQDYLSNSVSTSLNSNVNMNSTYESNDNKSKNDFQKFLGMNANKSVPDTSNAGLLRQATLSSAAASSSKAKNPENIKVYFFFFFSEMF
jgi:hypothetical protein